MRKMLRRYDQKRGESRLNESVRMIMESNSHERRLDRVHDDTSTATIVQTERACSGTHAIHRSCLDVGKRNPGIRCANFR
jgi:hypothetical protein